MRRAVVDLSRRLVRVGGADEVTQRETDCLHELVMHAGKVLTHPAPDVEGLG